MQSLTLARRLLLAAVLCTLPATAAFATDREEAEQAIAEAKAMREKAAAAGVTESEAAAMIEEAEGLMPSRQYTRAARIAYWAVRQDEFALKLKTGNAAPAGDKKAMTEALIADAEAAQKKAISVGGEWLDVDETIKSAKALAGAGEFDKAAEAASAAKFQCERGYEQALAERGANFPDYVRKALEK